MMFFVLILYRFNKVFLGLLCGMWGMVNMCIVILVFFVIVVVIVLLILFGERKKRIFNVFILEM